MTDDLPKLLLPKDPDFVARVRASFAQQGAMASIGAELVSVGPGECSIRLPYAVGVSQQRGYFHGGIISTIADSAGGYAAFSLCPPHTDVLTVEYKVNFIAPAKGEALLATGRVAKAGRTLIICRIDVDVLGADGRRTPCAILQQTMMAVAMDQNSVQPLRV